ncbi:MAG: hypothetical protein QM692_05655 [Thermomicrobiales bacterium]
MSALRRPTPPPEAPAPVAALPSTSREVLDAVRAAYTFVSEDDETQALSMLTQRPDIAATLLEALPHVTAVFGEDTPLLLLVINEHSEAPLRFSAQIVTTHDLAAAQAKRDAFYDRWWSAAAGPVSGDLSFGISWPRGA